jgi:phage recombination protein Bet
MNTKLYLNREKLKVITMTNALTQLNHSLTMWEDSNKINEIRKLFAPKLTEMEFQYFIGLGKSTGLNPFLKEIWSVKYDERTPAQVFIGRDGYRKAAQAHSEYDYHQCDAVYENDDFEIQDGIVKHAYKLTNRGVLIGAYCIAKRHKSSRPMYVFVETREYSTGKSVWGQKPATMIKKVAESQCLRACFQDLLGGTYGEEEMQQPIDNGNMRIINAETQTEKLKSILNENFPIPPLLETEISEIVPTAINLSANDDPVSQEDINKIETLMKEQSFDEIRKKRALDYFKIEKLSDLSDKNAKRFLLYLGENQNDK